MRRDGLGCPAGSIDSKAEVVIDMGIDTGKSELDPRQAPFPADCEHCRPGFRRWRASEPRPKSVEVESCKLNVQLREPHRVLKAAGAHLRGHGIGHRQIE